MSIPTRVKPTACHHKNRVMTTKDTMNTVMTTKNRRKRVMTTKDTRTGDDNKGPKV